MKFDLVFHQIVKHISRKFPHCQWVFPKKQKIELRENEFRPPLLYLLFYNQRYEIFYCKGLLWTLSPTRCNSKDIYILVISYSEMFFDFQSTQASKLSLVSIKRSHKNLETFSLSRYRYQLNNDVWKSFQFFSSFTWKKVSDSSVAINDKFLIKWN